MNVVFEKTKTESNGKERYQLCLPQSSLYIFFILTCYYAVIFELRVLSLKVHQYFFLRKSKKKLLEAMTGVTLQQS
jgi:hypothetical protein